jgi:hypothetical protein
MLLSILGLVACLALAALAMAKFNPSVVPVVIDTAQHIQDAVTRTASGNGTGLDLGVGFAPVGIGEPACAVVNITAMDETSGDESYTFTLQESADNSTFTNCGIPVVLTAVLASPLGSYSVYGLVNQRYVRVAATISGTTPSVTYSTDFGIPGVGA